MESVQVQQRRRSSWRASRCSWRSSPPSLWFCGPAAAPQGDRRTGGAVSRRARAVAAGDAAQRGRVEPQRRPAESAALVRKVVEQAIEACVAHGRGASRRRRRRSKMARPGGSPPCVPLLVVCVGPGVPAQRRVRDAARLRERRSRRRRIGSTSRRATSTVPKGADQTITAKLLGFASEDVVLMAQRHAARSAFEELPLVRNEDGSYDGMIFDVEAPLEYQVVADGVKSTEYKLTGRRRPVRAAARARIPLPGLHRPRAREDRGRRRHRRAARHRSPRAHHADDEDAGRADCAERQADACR